jgi:hypothetical protein
MAFLGNLFNTSQGSGFKAQGVPIAQGASTGQAQELYGQTQQGLAQQQAFINALSAQGGVQNQANVFNQLQNVAAGQGPNPAQAALAQATGANVANQAALMAGQRGAGANAGLLARQAAQQGAATQQQAAGQAATMQANQSLAAMGQLGNIAQQQVANQASALGQYQQGVGAARGDILGSINAQNQAAVSQQNAMNEANARIAAGNAQTQNQMGMGLISGAASALPGVGAFFKAHGGPIVEHHAMPEDAVVGSQQPTALGSMPVESAPSMPSTASTPKSRVTQYLTSPSSAPASSASPTSSDYAYRMGQQVGTGVGTMINKGLSAIGEGASAIGSKIGDMFSPAPEATSGVGRMGQKMNAELMAHGGKVPAMLSPGEKYLSPKEAKEVAAEKKSLDQVGKKVPGKAKVKGDSYENDVVPATLEKGGFVIPRSIMESDDPAEKAAAFVRAHMSRNVALKGKK